MELVEFLRRMVDADEAWARAASQTYRYAEPPAVAPKGGVHWRWVVGEQWETAEFDPAADEFVAPPGHLCWLATVEEWPAKIGGRTMPRSYANEIVEMDAAAAGHIARHDPARVLREVEAKRRIIDLHTGDFPYNPEDGPGDYSWTPFCDGCGNSWPCTTLRLLALPYADQPGYRDEWRP